MEPIFRTAREGVEEEGVRMDGPWTQWVSVGGVKDIGHQA